MVDLNTLSPEALKVAMAKGIDSWGQYGSVHHTLYVDAIKTLKRCRCGCRCRKTHAIMANGVALSTGCEFSIQSEIKQINKSKDGKSK